MHRLFACLLASLSAAACAPPGYHYEVGSLTLTPNGPPPSVSDTDEAQRQLAAAEKMAEEQRQRQNCLVAKRGLFSDADRQKIYAIFECDTFAANHAADNCKVFTPMAFQSPEECECERERYSGWPRINADMTAALVCFGKPGWSPIVSPQ
jgi:hypothetical protein